VADGGVFSNAGAPPLGMAERLERFAVPSTTGQLLGCELPENKHRLSVFKHLGALWPAAPLSCNLCLSNPWE